MAKDYPLDECEKAARALFNRGCTIFQKWTCEACGERVISDTPNKWCQMGRHDDCGHVTDLRKTGCNYAVGGPAEIVAEVILGIKTTNTTKH